MSKAIFLDRDGVITKELGYICPIDEVELFPYVMDCVRMIHEKSYLAIVITNQSGVARGIFTEEQLSRLNDSIVKSTGIDAVYYCPHHIMGQVKRYRMDCICRKPKIGLLKMAIEDYNIDVSKSYFVGDRATDILCAKNAGVTSVLVNSGYGVDRLELDVKSDYIMKDLEEFSNWLR